MVVTRATNRHGYRSKVATPRQRGSGARRGPQNSKMESVVQQLRTQLETVMGQLATTTQEVEGLRMQSYQADVKATEAKSGVDEVAQRVLAMETEVVRIRDSGSRPIREVNYVDIKTLKPDVQRRK